MKTFRADEFASRHSEDSIRSMAARSDEKMSFLLPTIDQIDEVKRLKILYVALVPTFSLAEMKLSMRFCSVKEWKGAYSISSGYNSTHILLNPTLEFIEEFKASLPNDSLALTNNDSSQWSVGTATSIRARRLKILYVASVPTFSLAEMKLSMRFCSVKEWKCAYSISSGYNSTHILLNPTLEFIEEFKASPLMIHLLLQTTIVANGLLVLLHLFVPVFFVLNERLTIREIIDSTLVGTFVTLGTIETIDTECGWQYLSCKYHNKKVMPTTNVDADNCPLFFCNTFDKEYSDVISRFKLIAHVKDDSGEANFLLFDANAQQIVHHSAAELYDENEDEDFLPEAVSDLFGKRVLFEISVDADNIKGKNSQYVVRLATDEREMVKEFADLPPKSVLMLESADDISSGSSGFS
ncbi:hypothetical protein F2Q69_00024922 [Brassica cretica]|uniref:Replication factor A C-terminal domain-containing protein n=1 Tax=Brassica cretica TaxID=69181 RepID=A0A8S9Q9I5_BRACR|nr:hypothetical protein F2Q69_00024922 [Brassica cretica]